MLKENSYLPILLIFLLLVLGASAPAGFGKSNATLLSIRGDLHEGFASVVFQFTGAVPHGEPQIVDRELHLTFFNTATSLKPFRGFVNFDSGVRLGDAGEDIEARIGIPEHFSIFSVFRMNDPHRIIVNLHIDEPENGAAPLSPAPADQTRNTKSLPSLQPFITSSPVQESGKELSPVQAPEEDLLVKAPEKFRIGLVTIRGGRHEEFSSVVFQFTDAVQHSEPQIIDREIHLTFFNTTASIKPFRRFRTFDSGVRLEDAGENIEVRIGIPESFSRFSAFRMKDPHRFVVNLYRKAQPEEPLAEGAKLRKVPMPEIEPVLDKTVSFSSVSDDSRRMALIEARILARKGFFSRSLEHFRRLRIRFPQDEEIWEEYIEILVDASHYELAEDEIAKLLERNPANFRAQRSLARIHLELRRFGWTFPIFDRLLGINKTDAGLWTDYAYARLETEDWAAALEYFSNALEIDPENTDSLRSLHEILKEHRPRLETAFTRILQTGEASITSASARYGRHLTQRSHIDFTYRWTDVDRPDSMGFRLVDEKVNEAVVLLRHVFNRNWQVRGGGGGYAGLGDGTTLLFGLDFSPSRNLILRGDYAGKRPWYDPVEAALFDGSLNQITASLDWTPNPFWGLFLGVEKWDYFIEGDQDYGTKETFTGILTRRLFEKPDLYLSYGYYASDFDQEADTAFIEILPAESIHSISTNFEHHPVPFWFFGISGGFRYDVQRSLSSFYILPIITFKLGNRIEFSLSYEYNSESGTAAGGETERFSFWNRVIF
ncbi:MAG: tetratricopeptide repeat protein [Desulfobacteraceae bacterium]|nr:MAG: tetratricopeptide repeat protein [Desulfobacteraceae bacterium]